eukprot:CAMPEP_0168392540 /NCGR_PEP_ID=MMETSP0228-20121227/18550_1 /TAXON_ID=133427 /ORGANISM="Protoceratium reticulatum, Strain CCCM 535 (=CCMP 1889)" /LENGTH=589 /DNA_ID=CAMNT_0008405883 /DNA_START=62 /DNA_END=1831 /DNA_ORIENTATION=+
MAPKGKAAKDSGDVSASVDESNKLRQKLGLRPLDTESTPKTSGSSNNPLHAPADAAVETTAEDTKKMKAAAKSKKEHDEHVKGAGLGDILAKEEGKGGAAEWVAKTRNKDGSMKAAGAPGAKPDGKKKKEALPETTEVPRLKVRHDAKDLPEGESLTMTLSDKPILDSEGKIDSKDDELSNVRMLDSEKSKHNEELKKQVEYDPNKEKQDILEKYDELKTGPAGFMIGGTTVGVIDEQDPEKKLAILTALSQKQSLETKAKLQSDYLTSAEMASFRKPPKRKTKRRKAGDGKDQDHVGDTAAALAAQAGRPQDAGSDEEDPELYEQLSKQRRLVRRSDQGAMKKGESALAAVSERIQSLDDPEEKEERDKAVLGNKAKDTENINMTATTEFCNVVQTPLEKMDTMKHESFRGSTLYKQQVSQRKGVAAGDSKRRRAGAAGHDETAVDAARAEEEGETLTEEGLDLSCASGLAYLRARAQIGGDQDSHRYRKTDNRPLEMSTVDGDIKLEYRDDFGRVQTPKEAFRAISWKFHGKVPGRKNMERRLLRLENEMKLKTMNPIESLPTLRALRHVQHADAKPYMVLSGANEK